MLLCSTHPHSTYIQILAETGLFGFAFFILPMVFICNLFWKRGILRRKDILTTYQIFLILEEELTNPLTGLV